MNKRQRNLLTKCLLALCLVVSMLVLQAPQAMAETLDKGSSAPVEVSTFEELQTAISEAEDGDVIGVSDVIEISGGSIVGSPDKHITLLRIKTEFNDVRFETIASEEPTAVLFQNITFDGGGISSVYSFVVTIHDAIFENVNFVNCISESGGGAITIHSGEIYFKNCYFGNNSGLYGGHILIDYGNANIENCMLKNGYAKLNGGAISVSINRTVSIKSSEITNNKADDMGGGILSHGNVIIEETKIYNNIASHGGSDISTSNNGTLSLKDSFDTLISLFADDGLTPTGWFYDYGNAKGISTPAEITSIPYIFLKLQFEEPDPQPELDEDEEEPQPQPEEPTPEPEPVKPPTSPSRGTSSWGSYTVTAKKEEPAPKAVVLTNGKATLDTTKTEYLLGFSDGLLGSKGTVTRAELAQIVYRLLTPESKADVYSNKNSFKDVAANAWYNEAVSTLLNAGLISMGADGKFNPDENITWGEMVAILAKFAEPNHEWKIITKHWARDALNTAISNRWFEYNDQFNPDGEVTRLEMLNFINTMFAWTTK